MLEQWAPADPTLRCAAARFAPVVDTLAGGWQAASGLNCLTALHACAMRALRSVACAPPGLWPTQSSALWARPALAPSACALRPPPSAATSSSSPAASSSASSPRRSTL